MQTQQAPASPAAPSAPGAPVAATAAPGTITITDADGTTKTIVLPGNLSPAVQRIAERAAERAANRPYEPRGDQFAQGMAAGVMVSLVVLGIRAFWRRYKRRGMPPAAASSNESPRLERMERGIEAIAIEVERISEGQRFVTNLLAESKQPTAISAERK